MLEVGVRDEQSRFPAGLKWSRVGIIVRALFATCMRTCPGAEHNAWGCGAVWVTMEEAHRESCILVVSAAVGVEYLKWGVVYDEIDVMHHT